MRGRHSEPFAWENAQSWANIFEALHPAGSYEWMYKGYPLTSPPTEGAPERNAQAEREREREGG